MSAGTRVDPFIKDPNAVLDYTIDWSDFLGADTIQSSAWTVQTGIIKNSDSNTSTTTVIWLSSGTVGTKYALTNRITTAGGRIEDRTIYVEAKEK